MPRYARCYPDCPPVKSVSLKGEADLLLDGMSIDDLAALRDQVVSTLADKVAERQRELAGEAKRLSALVGQPVVKTAPQARAKRPVKYRDGSNEWSGCGSAPAWVKAKGDLLENYRV